MIKRCLIPLLLAVLMLFVTCSCGGESASSAPSSEASSSAPPAEPSEVSRTDEPTASPAAYHPAADAFAGGSGTPEDPYQIGTPEELALFAQVNRTGQEGSAEYGKAHYVLTADIQLNDVSDFSSWDSAAPQYQWEPVEGTFSGSFDGKGFTVSGVYVNETGKDYDGTGFFRSISGAELKNLKLSHAYITADGTDSVNMDVGGIAGNVWDCRVENCGVEGSLRIAALGPSNAGGLLGRVYHSTVTGCGFSGDMAARACGGHIGGVIGSMAGYDSSCVVSDCTGEGSITLEDCEQGTAGGIAGYAGEGSAVSGCVNRMDLSGAAAQLGGVFGIVSVSYESSYSDGETTYLDGRFEATGCTNYGTVSADSSRVGGVIGAVFNMDSRGDSVKLEGLANEGTVSGGSAVGGIIGDMGSGYLVYTVRDCKNLGNVTGGSLAGGIIGQTESTVDGCLVEGCTNSGTVTAGSPAGGIIGGYSGASLGDKEDGLLTVSRCVNSGTVENTEGISGTGGIMGQIFMDGSESVLFTGCENAGTVRSAGPGWLGGILGGPGAVMTGGSWTARDCKNTGTLSIGSGTRDFAQDAAPELALIDSTAVDPSSMSEEEYQTSLEQRAAKVLGGSCVGGIAGKLWLGAIENCTGSGAILLDQDEPCYAGGICGQFYNSDGANGSSIRDCQYRADWPMAAMAAVGGLENLPEGTIVNVTADAK